jgi:hypothetical protein
MCTERPFLSPVADGSNRQAIASTHLHSWMKKVPVGAAPHILSMAAQEYWNDVANQPFDSQDAITQSLECRKEDTCTEEPLSSVAQL